MHRRASEWYQHNGIPADAIHHALAAKDFERVADLIELEWSAMRQNYHEATLLGWMQALSDELVRARPVLSVYYLLWLMGLRATKEAMKGGLITLRLRLNSARAT